MVEENHSASAAWLDEAVLVPVAEINELLIEILRDTAARAPLAPLAALADLAPAAPIAHGAQRLLPIPLPRLVGSLHELWCSLDTPAQRRMARCPYLLLDAGFAAPERWEWASLERAGLERARLEGGVMDGPAPRGYFASPAGVALVRRALVFAWHLARSNRVSARMLLGMTADCAERIAATPIRDLEALAEFCPVWIAPRWEHRPAVWRQLMQAAIKGAEPALTQVRLRGVQLLAGG
jgi:hypothetical protein